jgi:hypothetical protein
LLIPPEAINLLVAVNVPGDYLMAGFEVIMNGRFWVITEDNKQDSTVAMFSHCNCYPFEVVGSVPFD